MTLNTELLQRALNHTDTFDKYCFKIQGMVLFSEKPDEYNHEWTEFLINSLRLCADSEDADGEEFYLQLAEMMEIMNEGILNVREDIETSAERCMCYLEMSDMLLDTLQEYINSEDNDDVFVRQMTDVRHRVQRMHDLYYVHLKQDEMDKEGHLFEQAVNGENVEINGKPVILTTEKKNDFLSKREMLKQYFRVFLTLADKQEERDEVNKLIALYSCYLIGLLTDDMKPFQNVVKYYEQV